MWSSVGESGAEWKVAAACLHNDVLLDAEECHELEADCAHANVDSLVGSYSTEQTVWEILMEMERFKYRAGEVDQGAVALVLDLVKDFQRFSLPVVWPWATHSSFPWKILRVCECYAGTSPEESAV